LGLWILDSGFGFGLDWIWIGLDLDWMGLRGMVRKEGGEARCLIYPCYRFAPVGQMPDARRDREGLSVIWLAGKEIGCVCKGKERGKGKAQRGLRLAWRAGYTVGMKYIQTLHTLFCASTYALLLEVLLYVFSYVQVVHHRPIAPTSFSVLEA
jgi:hypothetical protein